MRRGNAVLIMIRINNVGVVTVRMMMMMTAAGVRMAVRGFTAAQILTSCFFIVRTHRFRLKIKYNKKKPSIFLVT